MADDNEDVPELAESEGETASVSSAPMEDEPSVSSMPAPPATEEPPPEVDPEAVSVDNPSLEEEVVDEEAPPPESTGDEGVAEVTAAGEGEPEAAEPEPEPEPKTYIEPLGTATEESLVQGELKPWILDKLFNEGSMGRLIRVTDVKAKPEDGGISKYEDYNWQLEKMYRKVPDDMSLGKVRLKPDHLLYEGERFILGRMFRDLREEDGYVPTAEREESATDLSDAVPVNINVVEKQCPLPVYPSPSAATMKCIQVDQAEEERRCSAAAANARLSQSGKVYEFNFSPMVALTLESNEDDNCDNEIPLPITPQANQGRTSGPGQLPCCPDEPPTNQVLPCCPSEPPTNQGNIGSRPPSTSGPVPAAPRGDNVSGRTCRNNLRCDSNDAAVCKAARSAMAIYDTLTGCDNFPCNIGDKPEAELENIEDSVWTWLYQIILKLVPISDSNENSLFGGLEERRTSDGNK